MVEAAVVLPPAADPNAAPAPDPKVTPPAFSIPDAYKEKPYLKGVDSQEKLFTLLDGAQELIGKRPAGIPAPDAPPEEWNKFYDALGRPKTAAEYKFELPEGAKVDEKVIGEMKEILHRHGLTPTQATGLQKDLDAYAIKMATAKGIALQQQNTDFDKLASDMFGADRDKIMARAKGLIDTFVPANLKGEVAKLSNENLIVLAGVLNGIHAKYIKTDGPPGQPGLGQETPDTLREKARGLMLEQSKIGPMDPRYDTLQKEIDALYRRAAGGQ